MRYWSCHHQLPGQALQLRRSSRQIFQEGAGPGPHDHLSSLIPYQLFFWDALHVNSRLKAASSNLHIYLHALVPRTRRSVVAEVEGFAAAAWNYNAKQLLQKWPYCWSWEFEWGSNHSSIIFLLGLDEKSGLRTALQVYYVCCVQTRRGNVSPFSKNKKPSTIRTCA
jgi:hypothetical protein